ncbi:SLC13 family permease [Sesbania bispinosa]|nr:SLC13 family permease [Sesbania bispinosa]
MATKSKVAEVVKEKSPAQSRHNMVLRQKSPTKGGVGQGEAQVHLKSPTKASVVQSERQVNLNSSTEAAVGQSHLKMSVRKADVGQNQTAEPEA